MPSIDDVIEQTPFQGYIRPLLDTRHTMSISRTLIYPRDVCEIFMEPDEVINARSLGRSNSSSLLSIDSFNNYRLYFDRPFTIITCLKEYLDDIRSIISEYKYKPIIVSEGDDADYNIEDIANCYSFDEKLYENLKRYSEEKNEYQELLKKLVERTKRDPNSQKRQLGELAANHNVTMPNEAVLISCGYEFSEIKNIQPSSERSNYIADILRTSELVRKKISIEKAINQAELILYSPSIFSYLYDTEHKFWNGVYRRLSSRQKKEFIKSSVIRNENYSGFMFELKDDQNSDFYFGDKYICDILSIRQFELKYTTIALSIMSLSNNCPSVRLPNSINFHPKKFKNLETLSKRHDKKGGILFKKAFREIVGLLKESVGSEIIDYVCTNSKRLTLCCDVPIEWVYFSDLPLMFSHEISRITTTPGNLLLINASNPPQMVLDINDLKKVLVIRSFKKNDPIKNHLENAVNEIEQGVISIEFFDVYSRIELIDVLNKYEGHVVIFDCHGGDGGNESHGWLNIGDERIDTWLLSGEARIPPIVILSACSTSAVGGSHASVANGLIKCGALSVIGTFLPVDSIKSSFFVVNILLKIAYFLDELSKVGYKTTCWRTIISSVLKTSYIEDILNGFECELSILKDEDSSEIYESISSEIYDLNDSWYDNFILELSEKTSQSVSDVKKIIDDNFKIVETMYYQQLGRPENIIINL